MSRSIINKGPRMFRINNDNDLIIFVNYRYNKTFTTVEECKYWISSQNNLFIQNKSFNDFSISGLTFYLDASHLESYPSSGDTYYDLIGDNNGTLTNSPTFNSNGWFDFDGIDNYIVIDESDSIKSTSNGQFSRMILFNLSSGNTADYPQIMWQNRTILGTNSSNNYEIYSYIGASFTSSGFYPEYDKWYNAILTYNNTTVKIYINGDLKVTSTKTLEDQTGDDLLLGSSLDANYIKGKISTAIGYNIELSEEEILRNYYQSNIVTDNLIAYFDSNNLVSYESGSTNTYTLTGTTNGTLINGVTYDGLSWEFDGTNQLIDLTSNIVFQDGEKWTINAWIYKAPYYKSFEFWIGGESGTNFIFGPNAETISFRDATSLYNSFGTYSDYVEKWTHHSYVCDGTGITCYLNGQYFNDITPNSTLFRIYEFGDGYSNITHTFKGKISNLLIYNEELTYNEIQQNYHAQKNKYI